MRIAISSKNDNINSEMSEKAGRSPYYLIFEDNNLVESIKNPFATGGGGAGFGVIQMLSNKNVDMIISGDFGPNLLTALKEKNMKHKSFKDKNIKEILEELE